MSPLVPERESAAPPESARLLIESVSDYAIFMLDPQGHVRDWNTGAARIKGFAAEEIVGRHFSVFYPPEDVAAGKCERELALASRDGRFEDEGWRLRKDGTRFWANVVLSAVRGPGGELLGFAKVTRDLTERRRGEEALRRSEERFRLLVDSVRDYAIFMLDPQGRVATWNRGAERIHGWRDEEVLGAHFDLFLAAEDRPAGGRQLALAERDGRAQEEGWRLRKDGTRFWASVALTAIRDPSGRLLGFAEATRDLTEQRRAEHDRIQLARAEEEVRLRDEFIAVASHELRTPLAALQLQLQSLRGRLGRADASLISRLERVKHTGDRLGSLVESLLDVAQMRTRGVGLAREELDLAAAVREVAERLEGEVAAARCTLAILSDEPLVGRFDRRRVEQIIANLIGNALKHAAGAPVEVMARRAGSRARIAIRDHGPGIPEKDLPRLFGRFERASSRWHLGGMGLGLYLARQIALAHGGDVVARNAPGGGAEFEVSLPLTS